VQRMRYLVVVEKGSSSYGAYVPDLPGCVAAGESREEVLSLIREAIALHIDSPAFTGGVLSEFKLRLSRVFLPLSGYVPPDNLFCNPDRGHKVPG
jgi:predicted RNase H-like HicB family nuclease